MIWDYSANFSQSDSCRPVSVVTHWSVIKGVFIHHSAWLHRLHRHTLIVLLCPTTDTHTHTPMGLWQYSSCNSVWTLYSGFIITGPLFTVGREHRVLSAWVKRLEKILATSVCVWERERVFVWVQYMSEWNVCVHWAEVIWGISCLSSRVGFCPHYKLCANACMQMHVCICAHVYLWVAAGAYLGPCWLNKTSICGLIIVY